MVRVGDGKVLGKTPWIYEHEPESGILRIILRLPGYASATALLDLIQGSQQTILLQRSVQAKPVSAQPASAHVPLYQEQIPYEK